MFKKGDRVRLNEHGLRWVDNMEKRIGVVFHDQLTSIVRVVWDGENAWQSYHEKFIEKVPDAE